ncbi:hypothetical protein SAMN02745111_02101 [Eubacterium uniforme]|uniref:Uncharacterized protein n=1 Tax=Eubacterium uniforme TaxID=39495 RepID=A0A1T4W216_9FIRM|nr:hypothetical protein [Eubacterium uniforme]SKA70751.1 hypothetical protein SAMN02745111_02101 [Eubacterium uniforme]
MSIKENRNNDVYDVLGMSDDFKRDLIDNCFYKIDLLERTGAEEVDEKNSNVWDASKRIKSRKHKRGIKYFVKGAVAVAAVGCLAFFVSLGVKYYNNVEDKDYEQSVPLKNVNETAKSEYVHRSNVKGQDLDHYDVLGIDSIHNAFESTDNEWYKESVEKQNELYYNNGEILEDYEEREFTYTDENGDEKTCKVVGKSFIVISKKEALKNAKNHLVALNYIYNSGSDDQEFDFDEKELTKEQNEFAEYEYVYYIQNSTLCRLKLTNRVEVWKDNSCDYYELQKVGNRVYTITSGMKSFFEHNFEDANVIKPTCIEITDEGNEKFEELIVYQKYFVNDNGKITMYYVDINDNLCKIEDIHITNYAGEKITGNELYKILQEGVSNYMGCPSPVAYETTISSGGLIEGVDNKTNKLKVICNENVYGEKKIMKHQDDSFIIYENGK